MEASKDSGGEDVDDGGGRGRKTSDIESTAEEREVRRDSRGTADSRLDTRDGKVVDVGEGEGNTRELGEHHDDS